MAAKTQKKLIKMKNLSAHDTKRPLYERYVNYTAMQNTLIEIFDMTGKSSFLTTVILAAATSNLADHKVKEK